MLLMLMHIHICIFNFSGECTAWTGKSGKSVFGSHIYGYSSFTQRGKKGKKKNGLFLNGVLMRPFATPLSANMMPSFRESSRGHEKCQYPPKRRKHRKILRNGENTKIQSKILITGSPQTHFDHLGVQPGSKLHARHDEHSEIIS